MAEQAAKEAGKAAETVEEEKSPIEQLMLTVKMPEEEKNHFLEELDSFIDQIIEPSEGALADIDKAAFESRIAYLDELLGKQLDEIFHSEEFQKVESAWRNLEFMVNRTDWQQRNVTLEIINVSKDELAADFEVNEITETGLYKHLYHQEYDQFGGEPVSTMVSNFEFSNSAEDIELLGNIARVAAAVHCPFIGSVGAKFFGVERIEDIEKIPNLDVLFDQMKYAKWNGFRERPESRFIGLTFPRFMLRAPYEPSKKRGFLYKEDVSGENADKYLWGNASFAMAVNMIKAFQKYGWPVQIRGPKAGGMVDDLAIHIEMETGDAKMPTEMLIPDHKELKYSNMGFIPFINEKGKDRACFYSANSAQRALEYDNPEDTATSRAMTRLPYILLASRIAHYLKVQQRESIGGNETRPMIEEKLNNWINGLVCKMNNPDPELISERPLRDAAVTVEAIEDDPGWYNVSMVIVPHFQIEGLKVNLSLMAQMPGAKE